jgi:hypothetical protein
MGGIIKANRQFVRHHDVINSVSKELEKVFRVAG